MNISKKQEWIVVAIFVAVFSFFVFDHIRMAAFWLDEAVAANILRFGFWNGAIFFKAIADSQPLFYILLLKIWSE